MRILPAAQTGWRRLASATGGGTAIEYALLAALITLVLISALGEVRTALVGLPLNALIEAFGSIL